jgi:hypothetical protein
MGAKTIAVIMAAAAVLFASVATPRSKVHLILDGSDGRILWNDNEAHLFIGIRHRWDRCWTWLKSPQ